MRVVAVDFRTASGHAGFLNVQRLLPKK